MDAGLCRNGGQCCILPLYVCLIDKSARQLVEQLLGFFGQDVLDEWLDVDVVEPVGSS